MTLPLSPTVSVQEAPLAHPTLQDLSQLPSQVELAAQSREQLPPLPQSEELNAQLVPAAQVQLAPTQVGAGVSLPHAARKRPKRKAKRTRSVGVKFCIVRSYSQRLRTANQSGRCRCASLSGLRTMCTAKI